MVFPATSGHYTPVILKPAESTRLRITDAPQHSARMRQYAQLDHVSLHPELTDSGEALQHSLEVLAIPIETSEARLEIHELPQLVADSDYFSLLFYCLLSNAITFCDKEPHITIHARRIRHAWLFCVADNGIGIDSLYHEIIFLPQRRIDNDSARPSSGMGLAIARKIVERHGGIVWVESSPQEGSTFYFTFPL